MAKCKSENCPFEALRGHEHCALHVEKTNYDGDYAQSGLLSEFHKQLIEKIIQDHADSASRHGIPAGAFRQFLHAPKSKQHGNIRDWFGNLQLNLINVWFPARDDRDPFDYLPILQAARAVWFSRCNFSLRSLEVSNVAVFYSDCRFLLDWTVTPETLLPNVSKCLYKDCTFLGDVTTGWGEDQGTTFETPLFHDCNFESEVSFVFAKLNKPVFLNSGSATSRRTIARLEIVECTFNDRFLLNGYVVETTVVTRSAFEEKVELKNNRFHKIDIVDTNFLKLTDFYESQFSNVHFEKCIFADFVGFERCRFGDTDAAPRPPTFLYVTFLGFVNFRSARFISGLDIQNVNLVRAPNFLGATVNLLRTNRETLRIIKNSFDEVGNKIEGNRYFAYEMAEYEKELSLLKSPGEKIILWLNKQISKFGQSYFRPITLIIAFSALFALAQRAHSNNLLYSIYEPANPYISFVARILNTIAANILPFSKLLKDGMEFVSLLFTLIFGVLIWQTIVAVKRHTRR